MDTAFKSTEQLPNRLALALIAFMVMAIALAPGNSAGPRVTAAINAAISDWTTQHTTQDVSVIVETSADPAPVEGLVKSMGGTITSQFSGIHGFSATVSPQLADRLNHDPRIARLNLNAPVKLQGGPVDASNLANRYEALSHIPSGWSAGYDGSQVQVAVIDTGVWPHDDLTKVSPQAHGNIGNRLLALHTNPNATDDLDHYGHGTHVAGIIAGNGYDSNGSYIGVAPNSLLVSVKVSDDLGRANEGDVITGLDWVYQANQHGMHIRVINLSLSSTVAQSYHASALDAEVEKLWNSGVVVVAAAGNGQGAVDYAPANDPFVITVGSVDDNYQTSTSASPMASWALYGKTQDGFQKPEVVADGSHVISLLAPLSQLSSEHPANIVGATYFKMGGTSMAAPQVAGLVALMLQAQPSLTPNRVKRALRHSSQPFGSVAYTPWLGTPGGLVDVSAINDLETEDNTNVAVSQSFDPVQNTIQAGGAWWPSPTFGNAPWNNVSWSMVSWSDTAWANVSWSGGSNPSAIGSAWSNVSWSMVSWSNVSWSMVSWSNVSWSNVSWSNVSWSNVSWSDSTWN